MHLKFRPKPDYKFQNSKASKFDALDEKSINYNTAVLQYWWTENIRRLVALIWYWVYDVSISTLDEVSNIYFIFSTW